jgi:hypothetical protein
LTASGSDMLFGSCSAMTTMVSSIPLNERRYL